MIKTILLDAEKDSGFQARLQAAVELTSRFKAHLVCLQVTPVDTVFSGEPIGSDAVFPSAPGEIEARDLSHMEDVAKQLAREHISWEWVHEEGLPTEIFVDRAALADLVILSGPSSDLIGNRHSALASSLAMACHSPLLCVPLAAKPSKWNGPSLIAWDGSLEAAHALRQALPLLKESAGVDIITVGRGNPGHPPEEARLYLKRHRIASQLHHCKADGSTANTILKIATALNSKFIVMGAFGRSRLLEAVLGGVTRTLMTKSPVPLLIGR